jgi:hypothetical protein
MTRRKIKVTSHARSRARERLGVSYHAQVNKSFNDAIRYGHPMQDFNGEFSVYLARKKLKYGKNLGIKVYMDIIVIYRNKTVITTYKVPDKFQPASKYLRSSANRINNDLPYLAMLRERLGTHEITTESKLNQDGLFRTALYVRGEFIRFGLGKTECKSINNAIKSYIKILDKEASNEEGTDTEQF